MTPVQIIAGIIQGEASNPSDQYGVASTIYNRNAGVGGFSGFGAGQGALAVATARGQYSAYGLGTYAKVTPSPYATQLATNLVNGEPPGSASTGNALYYNAPGFNAAYASGVGNDFGPGTNQYSDRFNQPPSQNFQLPGGGGEISSQATLDMSGFGTQPIQDFSPNLTGVTPQDQPVTGDTQIPTQTIDQPIASDTGQTPIIDSSGNQIGTEAPIPQDFSTLQNFGAIDPTAGSAFGGAFDSSGNVVAGSSGDVGGLGLPSGLFAGGSGGGGLGYQVKPANVSVSNEAATGTPIEIPDVATAVGNVGKGINTTLGSVGSAIGESIGGAFSQAVTSAENYAGNFITRGGAMVLAVIFILVAGFMLMPRGTKEAVLARAT